MCRRMIDSFQQLEAEAYADMWHDSVALLVGSDAEEWWTGSADVKALIHAQFAAMRDSDEYKGPVSWMSRRCRHGQPERSDGQLHAPPFGWRTVRSRRFG